MVLMNLDVNRNRVQGSGLWHSGWTWPKLDGVVLGLWEGRGGEETLGHGGEVQ